MPGQGHTSLGLPAFRRIGLRQAPGHLLVVGMPKEELLQQVAGLPGRATGLQHANRLQPHSAGPSFQIIP